MYSYCLYNLKAFAHKKNSQQPLQFFFVYVKTGTNWYLFQISAMYKYKYMTINTDKRTTYALQITVTDASQSIIVQLQICTCASTSILCRYAQSNCQCHNNKKEEKHKCIIGVWMFRGHQLRHPLLCPLANCHLLLCTYFQTLAQRRW